MSKIKDSTKQTRKAAKTITPSRGELDAGEPHPAAYEAKAWIAKQDANNLFMWRESFASCAIEGNRLAEVCGETLGRLLNGQPISDRYVLGLAWTMMTESKDRKK